MDPSRFDSELDRRLASQARPTPMIDESTSALLVNLAEVAARGQRRRLRYLSVASLLVCGVLAVPTAAIASSVFGAQTGTFNAEEDGSAPDEAQDLLTPGPEGAPGAEWIDMGSSDLNGYIASVAPRDLPLPDGVTWDDVLDGFFSRFSQSEYLASNSPGGEGVKAESVVIDTMLENEARRAWLRAWFAAYDTGDDGRMKAIGAVLERSVDWPAEQATSRGAYAEQTREWMRMIGGGDYAAAQAYAQFYDWTELWDGNDRGELSGGILAGSLTAQSPDETP
ncbi:hypothetical protein [Leucobacter sp. wl10]|uniref:hypothetical protein n=1 Tax=Leucobacter sp. wl10 TaxID=2304677 RepID=UPI000E5AF8BC|nr:hypothetical protein [Leucobacter sp. wl10]RGE19645.1 hypothetical protein D1J51_11365 [Leucobacter sp. wl10]